jgi:hypothetical protein
VQHESFKLAVIALNWTEFVKALAPLLMFVQHANTRNAKLIKVHGSSRQSTTVDAALAVVCRIRHGCQLLSPGFLVGTFMRA